VDIGGSFKLTPRVDVFFTARNVFNEPVITMEKRATAPAVPTTYEITSAVWTFGVKGVW
jgi:hypothetical protein